MYTWNSFKYQKFDVFVVEFLDIGLKELLVSLVIVHVNNDRRIEPHTHNLVKNMRSLFPVNNVLWKDTWLTWIKLH